jgi:outer membrane receptor protein involved in Fe transport
MACAGAAQENLGDVLGTVRDASGGVLPAAELELESPSLIGIARTVADGAGRFRFPALPPGTYQLTARHQGFTSTKVTGLEIVVGKVLKVDPVLELAGVTEEVSVIYDAPQLDVKGSSSAESIRNGWLHKLPRGRDFTSVVDQLPGVNNETDLAGVSIDGAGAAENRYFIDGADTAALDFGWPGKDLVLDFVEEVQVKSSGYEAEFGGATGGVLNVITRSGGSQFRSEVGLYYMADNLNGPSRTYPDLDPIDNTTIIYKTDPKDDYSRWEPGFTLGGPILAENLWFFTSYWPRLESASRTVTFIRNGETDAFNQKRRIHFSTSKLTARLGPKVRAALVLNFSPKSQEGQLPSYSGWSNPDINYEELGFDAPNLSITGQADVLASDDLYFSFRASLFRTDYRRNGVADEIKYWFQSSNYMFPEIPESLLRPSYYSNIWSNSSTEKGVMTRTLAQGDVTYYTSLAGEHSFKAGVQLNRPGTDLEAGFLQPYISLYWDRTLTTTDGRRVRGTYGYYEVGEAGIRANTHVNNIGLFAQDSWTVTPRLTLNLGLRAEQERIPSYTTEHGEDKYAINFGFADKLAPRLGFAWDPKGDGRWKVYGSWGLYYDIMKIDMPLGSFGSEFWISRSYSLDTYDWPSIGVNGYFPGEFYEELDFSSERANDPEDFRIDPNLEPMRQREMTLGLQHELNQDTMLAARYVQKRLDRAIEDVGILVPGRGEVYFIANPGFGIAEHLMGEEFPALPKARRDYDALELSVKRRMSSHWALQASYVWSRLYGNYSGLVGSDEYGRASPNHLRAFDGLLMSFDQNAQPVFGPLATDRPHQFKAQGIVGLPIGTLLSAKFYIASGTPVSREVRLTGRRPILYLGRHSDGRTPVFSQTDLYIDHDFEVAENKRIQLSLNIINLFDQDTTTGIDSNETWDNIFVTNEKFFQGIDVPSLIEEQETYRNPFFLMGWRFQSAREIRLGIKFLF